MAIFTVRVNTSTADGAGYDDPDIAFGGGGRDTLIGNTTADRLIDWSGNFNRFAAPFNGNGSPVVVRSHNPAVIDFLIALSRSEGADQSRADLTPSVDHGELGLQDTGTPAGAGTNGNNGVGNGIDPQPPGNPPVNDGPGTVPGSPGRKKK